MSKSKKRAKWVDPRTPVSVTHIGKFTVTIYDQAAYEESIRLYPDEDETSTSQHQAPAKANHVSSQFVKPKVQARYNWTTPLTAGTRPARTSIERRSG